MNKMKESKKVEDKVRHEDQKSIYSAIAVSNSNSTQRPPTFSRNRSQPGAFAIPGPQLVRQERISAQNEPYRQHEPEILIEARVVDEEEPSIVFEAFLLRKRKNWKWILAVCCLAILLAIAVGGIFHQAASRKKILSSLNIGQTYVPSSSPLNIVTTSIPTFHNSLTQTNIPSLYKASIPSDYPTSTIHTEQSTFTPTKQITTNFSSDPTLNPTEMLTNLPTHLSNKSPSQAPSNIPTRASSRPTFSSLPSQEPSRTASLLPSAKPSRASSIPTVTPSSWPSFMPTLFEPKWKEVGKSIIGEDSGDNLGKSIALSLDGQILAIGIYLYDNDTEKDSGEVRVLKLESDNSWKPIGQALIGNAAGVQTGWAIDLSANGSIIAVSSWTGGNISGGTVQVFYYEEEYNIWLPLGQKLPGGSTVSLSYDGMNIMVGADTDDENGEDAGRVRIYRYNSLFSQWTQVGQTFQGELPFDRVGIEGCLNSDGMIVALGVPDKSSVNDDTENGLVRVYERIVGLTSYYWSPLGGPISEEDSGFGSSIDLSADGMTLIVSSTSGVYVYKYDTLARDWVETLPRIQIQLEGQMESFSKHLNVSISPNGNIIAVGRTDGKVEVFEFKEGSSEWMTLGQEIESPEIGIGPTPSISLASDKKLAVGYAEFSSGEALSLGKVQVFELQLEQ